MWRPAQTPKSSYLGRERAILLCGGLTKPQNRPISARCFVVACPNPKIVLSRRDKAILLCGGLPKPQNRPISARCFVVACPNPKIVLSRRDKAILLCGRDKAILLCGGLPNPQNRPISARQGDFALWWPAQTPKSSYLGEIRRFCFVVERQNRPISAR